MYQTLVSNSQLYNPIEAPIQWVPNWKHHLSPTALLIGSLISVTSTVIQQPTAEERVQTLLPFLISSSNWSSGSMNPNSWMSPECLPSPSQPPTWFWCHHRLWPGSLLKLALTGILASSSPNSNSSSNCQEFFHWANVISSLSCVTPFSGFSCPQSKFQAFIHHSNQISPQHSLQGLRVQVFVSA